MRYVDTLAVAPGDLRPYPGNARTHDEAVLDASVARNGQYRSVVARRLEDGTLQLLAGHGTAGALARAGVATVRVEVVEADDEEARRIVLVDNRANDLAGYDEHALLDLLRYAAADFEGTGWTTDAFDALVASLWEPPPVADPDDAPPVPAEPLSRVGDVWVLGPHRLVCGDSTDPAVAALAADGALADCMWTDPPYGVDYVGGNHELSQKERLAKGGMTVRNDGAADLDRVLNGAFQAANGVLAPGAAVYIAHADTERVRFQQAMLAAGWSFRQNLIWVKDSMVLGRSDYHYRHEPILYGMVPSPKGTGRRGRGASGWYGDARQTTVLEVARPSASKIHPTMKPTELIVRCLQNSCRPGGVVYEPFGGSGSTLVAAHLTGRQARVVELDPGYTDVICRRWQSLTGVLPVRAESGVAHDFLEPDPVAQAAS